MTLFRYSAVVLRLRLGEFRSLLVGRALAWIRHGDSNPRWRGVGLLHGWSATLGRVSGLSADVI